MLVDEILASRPRKLCPEAILVFHQTAHSVAQFPAFREPTVGALQLCDAFQDAFECHAHKTAHSAVRFRAIAINASFVHRNRALFRYGKPKNAVNARLFY